MRRNKLSTSFALSTAFVLALLVSAIVFPGTSFADNWTRSAAEGISGGFAPPQESVSSMAWYNSVLYAGTEDPINGCQVWAHSGGSWSKVIDGGFGDIGNKVANTMVVYDGKLYVGTGKFGAGGAEVWSFDGTNWSQVNSDGFGSPDNILADSMVVHNGALYVGTRNNLAGGEIWKYMSGSWSRVADGGFGNANNIRIGAICPYGGDLFAGTFNFVTGAEVWRYNGGSWTQSVGQDPAGTLGTGPGFGGGNENQGVSAMIVHDGKLNVGLTVAWSTNAWIGPIPGLAAQHWAHLMWSYDGTDWDYVSGNGFGGPSFTLGDIYLEAVLTLGIYNSQLIAGSNNAAKGCGIWIFNGSSWTELNDSGFGKKANIGAEGLAVSGSEICVGTRNVETGAETWRYDGTNWTNLSDLGFAENNNYSAGPMLELGSKLYAATSSGGGAGLWQFDGAAWSLKGAGGFGDAMNKQVSSMTVFNSEIYLGTRNVKDGGEVYRFDGTNFTQVNNAGFQSTETYPTNKDAQSLAVYDGKLYAGVFNETKSDNYNPGCRIYMYSGSGTNWTTASPSAGFGDSNNVGVPSMCNFDNALFVGTYNKSTGCEVWKKNTSGGTSGWAKVNTDGFGDASTHSASVMLVMDGNLYVGTSGDNFSVWRYDGGTNWTNLAPEDLGDTGNTGVISLAALGDTLYAGTSTGEGNGMVYRYDGTNWERAAQPGFGAEGNSNINSLAGFNSRIYASTANALNGCEIWSSAGPPGSIQSITPKEGSQGDPNSFDVTITGNGTRFTNDSEADFGKGITVNETIYISPTQVTAKIKITADAAPGKRDVNVTTLDDTPKALKDAFTVLDPKITGVSPATVEQGETTTLTITGEDTRFTAGANIVEVIGSGINVGTVTDLSDTKLSVAITVNDDASEGPRGLKVTANGIPVEPMAQAFAVGTAPPRLDKVTPTVAYVGEEVTLKGEWFGDGFGASKVTFNGKAASYIAKWNHNNIVCKVPAGAKSGPVVVKTEAGTSNSKSIQVVNTKPGTNVLVNAGNGVMVMFERVTKAGNTRASAVGDPVLQGFTVIPGTTRNVTTTAGYTGKIRVTFTYTADLQRFQQEGMLVLHEETGKWVDVTVDRNLEEKTITGEVDSLSRFVLGIPGDVTVPAGASWYLAEGSTAHGFSTYISIENPNPRNVTARVTYMTDKGPQTKPDFLLPAMSQTTLNPADDLGQKDFSTKVECLEAETIAVDRTMTWTGEGAASPESHNSIGVSGPNNLWYLPEGSSKWGFETWLLIQNPNDADAVCEVTYMVEDEDPVTVDKTVEGNSRGTFHMADDIGAKDASIKVECPIPVIAERAMYRNSRREGHDSVGATEASNNYFLAEGTTAWGFTTYVLVQNPNDEASDIEMTFMTNEGWVAGPSMTMEPNSRETFRINDLMPNRDFSTEVTGSLPIIAERAMYWDSGTGEVCHDSIGETGAHTTFYFPDGQSTIGYETWTLVQNPNDTEVDVEISYLTPTGAGNITFTETVPANSRSTFNMGTKIMNVRAAIMVTCKTPGQTIMAERAMYWNNRGAGTNSIGGYTD